MKRSNFIATIAAIFLAPFGIKANTKSDFVKFSPDPSMLGVQHFSCWVRVHTGCIAPTVLFRCNEFEIKCPILPDDDRYHQVVAKRHKGTIEYFIDGKRVFI